MKREITINKHKHNYILYKEGRLLVVEFSSRGYEIVHSFINNVCRQNQFKFLYWRRITGPRRQMQQILGKFKTDLVNIFFVCSRKKKNPNGGNSKKMGHS